MTGKKGETPSIEALVPDAGPTNAERQRQPPFSLSELFQAFVIGSVIVAGWFHYGPGGSREVLGPRSTLVEFRPIRASIGSAEYKISGAWVLRSDDPRFGGFSDLLFRAGGFIGLTDRGAVARFGKPVAGAAKAAIKELPPTHGQGVRRKAWDTEALELAADGLGYWVSFEQIHQLRQYDLDFRRPTKGVRLGNGRWPVNLGVEGLVTDGEALMLFAESRPEIGIMSGEHLTFQGVEGLQGRFSEALRLQGGQLLAIERRASLRGFHNALVELELRGSRYRVIRRHPLKLGILDNMEGLTAEPLPDGRIRLWLISDDNYERPLRTVLLAIDLPPER